MDLTQYIRDIPDFPQSGILFRDITPLLASHEAFGHAIDRMAELVQDAEIDAVVAAEARGFIFATPLALKLGAGFIPIRKPGKLPFDTHAFHYELEYGADTLEMHIDGLKTGQRVLVVDDLLATGGTVRACCELVEKCGAHVAACLFLVELVGLDGRRQILPRRAESLIQYD